MIDVNRVMKELESAKDAIANAMSVLSELNDNKPGVTVEKTPSLEDVRGILADKSRDGFTSEVKALLKKYGAEKLSEVDPDNYQALIDDAGGIGNAG